MGYFDEWLKSKGWDNDPDWIELKDNYEKAEQIYDDRFNDYGLEKKNMDENKEKKKNANEKNAEEVKTLICKTFDKPLKKINMNWDKYQSDKTYGGELKKMAHFAKGNILLLKGQALGERFYNPHECYQQAGVVLEQGFNPQSNDFLNLAIQLSLGKYFRALGRYKQRSDYLRALDEFTDVKNKLETSTEPFTHWETHLWLEAEAYIGLAERYLYRLRDAKKRFLNMIGILSPAYGRDDFHQKLRSCMDLEEDWSKIRERLHGDNELYRKYLIQALVELSIAYQKSRDYDIAQDICAQILIMDGNNPDAANNLAICLRKQREKIGLQDIWKRDNVSRLQDLGKNPSEYLKKPYPKIFEILAEKGNRFAHIHNIKYQIYEENSLPEAQKSINRLLEMNPNDQDVRFLQALVYRKTGDLDLSMEKFECLYKESPHIAKGTIGLKAYYNIAKVLLEKQKFHEAQKYLERIEEECRKRGGRNVCSYDEEDKQMRLDDLPQGDLLAEIDIGWCLLNIGDYSKAAKCYENILKTYHGRENRLKGENEMKIKNNLGLCYLHLGMLDEAEKHLMDAIKKEPDNATTNSHLGYYYRLKCEKSPTPSLNFLQDSLNHFEKAAIFAPDDIYIHSGWISSALLPLLNKGWEGELSAEEKEKRIQSIENKLKYSSGIYSIKSCAKLASFIINLEAALQNGEYQKEKLETMYRSFARVRLGENEEGCRIFRDLLENGTFRRLEAVRRGKLLVALFSLYDKIIRIKEICRFVPTDNTSKTGNIIPAHYTKIDVLKALLSEEPEKPGRLRLWNTVYMNDSFEGECFMEMMRHVNNKNDADEMLKKYFTYLNKKPSNKDSLVPVNENIYVGSFSEQTNAIHMWVPYGDDAQGCTITFTDDFFDIRRSEDKLTDVSSYSDNDYPLYQIQYLDEKNWKAAKLNKSWPETQSGDNIQKILDIMKEIWDVLYDLEDRLQDRSELQYQDASEQEKNEEANTIRSFVEECLNGIRFLIKNSEYSYESEIRMLHYSHDHKIESENFEIPRLYVEVQRDIQIKEVSLGSKVNESQTSAIVSWLNKSSRVESITKSGRHYK